MQFAPIRRKQGVATSHESDWIEQATRIAKSIVVFVAILGVDGELSI